MSDVAPASRETKRLRYAAYAAFAWAAILLVLHLPLGTSTPASTRWVAPAFWAVAPFVLLATALLRGTVFIGALLGAYGLYGLAAAGWGWIRVFTGHAVNDPRGPGVVWAATLMVPFAVVWVRGGVAAWRVLSARAPATPDATDH